MINFDGLEERFEQHTSICILYDDYEPFYEDGIRFIRCEKCKKIVSTDSCVSWGGEGLKMFSGLCRDCFGHSSSGGAL